MSETAREQSPAESYDPKVVAKFVRLDRSRAHSSVHGVRGPGDPHQYVAFYQDGLPFDAQGILIIDHPDYLADDADGEKRRKTVKKKLEKAARDNARKLAAVNAAGGPDMPRGIDDIDEDEEVDEEEGGEVNLEEWLCEGKQYEWQEVSNAIAARFQKRVASVADAVEFLAEEMSIPKERVAKKFRKYL